MISLPLALLAMAPATTDENSSDCFPTLCRAITSETWDQTGNLLLLYNAVSLVWVILYHKSRICQYLFASIYSAALSAFPLIVRREGPSAKDSFTKAEGEDSLSPQNLSFFVPVIP